MIVLARQEGRLASGDALLAIHLRQVYASCDYLQELANRGDSERKNEFIDQAAQVCEMSRDLVYRLNRVSVSQIKEIVKAFGTAVAILRSLQIRDAETSELIESYAWHIQKRVTLLEREIEPFSQQKE